MKVGWPLATAACALVGAAGGAMMLVEDVSEPTRILGVNVLALGLLGVAVSGLGAWLVHAKNGHDPRPVRATDHRLGAAKLIFVVRRDRRDLYESFCLFLAPEAHVDVVLDRRERPRDAFDVEVRRRGWSVARVSRVHGACPA